VSPAESRVAVDWKRRISLYVSGYSGRVSTSASGSGLDQLVLRSDAAGRTLLPVRVQPRSSRTAVEGVVAGSLKVRLQAAPVAGAANAALLKFLGRKVLGLAPSALEIVRGAAGRDKIIAVVGASAEQLRSALARHL